MADSAKPLIPQHRRTDAPPVLDGLRSARIACYATFGLTAAGLALSPNSLLLPAATTAAAIMGLRLVGSQIVKEQKKIQQLGAKRTFAFADLPCKNDEEGKPILRPDRPMWEPEGVRVEVIKDVEEVRSATGVVTRQPWYRWKVVGDHLWHYQQQEAWLREHHPDRFAVVRKWWLVGFVVPALERRHENLEFTMVEGSTAPGAAEAGGFLVRCCQRGEPASAMAQVDGALLAPVVNDYLYQRYLGVRLALQPQMWTRRLERRPSLCANSYLLSALMDLYPQSRPKNDQIPDNIRALLPVYRHVLFGNGVKWERRHAQKLYEQYGYDVSSVSSEPPDGGDPRILGCAADEIDFIYLEERLLEQHCIIAGATGTGKTRFADPILVQAIRCGYPVVFIDPKGDRTMLNRFYYEGRRAGRGHRIHLFHFQAPLCPEVSSYNGMYMYDDPAELASRAASIIEKSKDPFWFRVGMSTLKAVTTLSHYVLKFLQMTGAGTVDGKVDLYPRYSAMPPRYIMALALLQVSPELKPADADTFITTWMAKRRDRAWAEQSDVKVKAQALKALSEGWFNPYVWNPSLRPVNVYGVGAPEVLVGWALRVVYAHWWPSMLPESSLREVLGKSSAKGEGEGKSTEKEKVEKVSTLLTDSKPDALSIESILGMSPMAGGKDQNANKKVQAKVNWMTMWRKFKNHPLLTRFEDDTQAWGDPLVMAYMDYFCPRAHFPVEEWRRLFEQFDQSLLTMFGKASEDRLEYRKHMATLTASLQRFEGERDRIISSVDPDIVLRQVIERNEMCYMNMNYMKDTEAVEGMARIIVCDAMSYLGAVYGYSATGRKEWYLCCDEVGTFLSEQMVPILSQGRSAGVRTILLGQNLVDYEVAMHDRNKALQAIGNLTLKVQLRTEQKQDADLFAEKAGKVFIDVRGSVSHNINPGYGKSGSAVVDAFTVNSTRGTNEREVPLVSTSALFSLPLGHAFLNGMGKTHLLVQGMLPQPPCNILEEFDIIRYSDERGEEKPLIVERRKAELAATRTAMQRFMPRTRGTEDEGVDPGIRMVGGVDTRAGQSRTHVSGDGLGLNAAGHDHRGVRGSPDQHSPKDRAASDSQMVSHGDDSESSLAFRAERQKELGPDDDVLPPQAQPDVDDDGRSSTPPHRYDDDLTVS